MGVCQLSTVINSLGTSGIATGRRDGEDNLSQIEGIFEVNS